MRLFKGAAAGTIPVSAEGGAQVRWRRDAKELFYIALDGALMAVPIGFGPSAQTVELGKPVRLFATNVGGAVQDIAPQQYTVSADGQRFLMSTVIEPSNSVPIRLILNWSARGL